MSDTQFAAAALAFRRFFSELREAFLEREALFTQIELAMLCREHVLVVGPPGTAKSSIATAVVSRILDETTGAPSLFAKQLSESTVQTDLIGAVDFKVLTETGRTEYLTDEGMLGATYAFLDEVFDGRDMLLRSILNVLHERELKHGRRVTTGRIETAILTSNRYLSEVLARSPELMLAFADRLSFICFVPKSFARHQSRAAMLQRSVMGQRPDLRAPLSLQQLDVLQDAMDRVQAPGAIMEGLELLADELEKAVLQQVSKLPDYVPTKYFSQRSCVKALWALKAAVVRDKIYRHPDRPLEVQESDLEMLRHFFLLGGPPPQEVELLLKAAVDPRERAQLEIVRMEHRAFDEVLEKVRPQLSSGLEREQTALKPAEDLVTSEAMARTFEASTAATHARALRQKLVPGPRHPQNREPLLSAARVLVAAVQTRIDRGISASGEGRGGAVLLGAFQEVLELTRAVPELHALLPRLMERQVTYVLQALEMVALGAEGSEFEEATRLDALGTLAAALEGELAVLEDFAAQLRAAEAPGASALAPAEQRARQRAAEALRRRAVGAFTRMKRKPDGFDTLSQDARRLAQLDRSLTAIWGGHPELRGQLLAPLGLSYARALITETDFQRIEQFARVLQGIAESLRREGLDADATLAACAEEITTQLQQHAQALGERVRREPPAPTAPNPDAYALYRERFAPAAGPEGELAALDVLEGQLASLGPSAAEVLSANVKTAVASAELIHLQNKLVFLRTWLGQLLKALPAPNQLKDRLEAERTFDRLVKSRFPMLAMKEGELLRLQSAITTLGREHGAVGDGARELGTALRSLSEEFGSYSQRLLQVRASL